MSLFKEAEVYEHEREPGYWEAQARSTLDAALKLRPLEHRAKNIILFLGDGRTNYCQDDYTVGMC